MPLLIFFPLTANAANLFKLCFGGVLCFFYDFLCIQIILGLKAAKIMAALIDDCADKRSCSFISYNSTC